MTDEEFRKAMKELCASRWITQRFVAHVVGVRSMTVARWVAGKGLPGDPKHREHIKLLHAQRRSWHTMALPFLLTDYALPVSSEAVEPNAFFVRATARPSDSDDTKCELLLGASFDRLTFTMRSLCADLSADGKTWSSDLRFGPVRKDDVLVVHVQNAARARRKSLNSPPHEPAWRP